MKEFNGFLFDKRIALGYFDGDEDEGEYDRCPSLIGF